jgi:hypothetical protein
VYACDFAISRADGTGEKSAITGYVVTPAGRNFDRAHGLVKSAVETGSSRTAHLGFLLPLPPALLAVPRTGPGWTQVLRRAACDLATLAARMANLDHAVGA